MRLLSDKNTLIGYRFARPDPGGHGVQGQGFLQQQGLLKWREGSVERALIPPSRESLYIPGGVNKFSLILCLLSLV